MIATARESPIQNRHVDPVGTRSDSLRISPFPRFSSSNVFLDYVNPRRGNRTGSACDGDRKLCSTRRENSSPGGIGIAYMTTIRNRHTVTVNRTPVS
ncbi:hypothetical protein Taro_051501 [Colocasia esculenta]|uniref:Uncharacterized protein n=1 Tax=Colocasia esculenta TaxID=4460 RepID=A0A843XH64_COLES|nr:hypothetical protein [Colocasia esculenta]